MFRYTVSVPGYHGCSKGGGGSVKGMLYRVADTKGVLRGRGYCLGYFVSCHGYQGYSRVEGVLLRI